MKVTELKNLKITTFDGKVWYPTFYDMDTCLGIDNSGYLTVQPDVEIEEGSFNTSNSNLWTKVMNFFASELKEEWSLMRQGRFTLDNLMKYVIQNQIDVIPAKYYNDDAQVKYLDFGSLYTYCCHGNKELLVKRWLRERIAYVDSMMDYFTSQDDQVTIRMNRTGYVEFSVTPYVPLYFSVKWSNADGGTQTFKLKRGETKTFYYTSTTATDQEVIIYHAQYIKELGGLSNLRPSSCILANATKLNNVEIHSDKLYNVNVSNNKYLRKLDLSGCSTLGTVTATGSVLDVSNCKYLSYLNIDDTALTGVLLNTSGGSLKEIYYPKTIQEVKLIKQTLLEKVGLPYGSKGENIPTSLYTVNIQECPNIKILNTSSDNNINKTWISMKYCQNLTVRNSLDFEEITLDGFQRLKVLKLENMFKLKALGFDDMLVKGEASTLQYMGVSYCPELTDITMNCTSNKYEITFADGALLNLSGATNLNSISSNCIIHGLETIVLPLTVKHLYFTSEYGTGYSSIKNIWSSRSCEINEEGVLPVAIRYENKDFIGMDLLGMKLNDIDLGALVNIPKAINFDLSPTSVNPNFNVNRDGVEYPYLQPEGILDLSNYTESLARFFNGVDLDKLEIVVNNPLPQTDLSYCFYNATFSDENSLKPILDNVSSINNLDYCFYKTIVSGIDILENINMGDNSSMNYTFAECSNITSLEDITIPSSVVSVEGMFNKCPLTSITNMTVNVNGSIKGLFKGCSQLATINVLNIPNVTDASSLFEGCENLSVLTGFELPTSCTKVDNLFNGCNLLTRVSLNFGSSIVSANMWFPPNLQEIYDTTISTDYVTLANCSTINTINNLTLRISNITGFFTNCTNLRNIDGLDIGGTVTSVKALFRGTNFDTFNNVQFGDTIIDFSSCFRECAWLTNDHTITIKSKSPLKNYNSMFQDCTGLTRIVDIDYNCSDTGVMYSGCTGITEVDVELSNATKCIAMFLKCTSLQKARVVIPDTCTDIERLFYLCTKLSDISGSVFGSGITVIDNWLVNTNIKIANDVIIKNNIINFTNNKTLQYAKNLSRPNSNNWDNFFKGCTELKEDIIFPSNTVSVVNCFNGCTKMTHIHSNWENEYENEITPTDCYAGCTGITHRDGLDLGVNEYIKGLDDVPPSWGGYGLHSDYSTICVMNIPSDNFEMVLNTDSNSFMFDDKVIEWGDGAVTYGINRHVYEKAGEYVIRGKYWFNNVNLVWARNIMKLIKGPYGVPVSGFYVFSASSLLTYANISNMTINNASSMFNMYQAGTAGGPFLSEIVIKNTRILQGVAMNSFFASNKALTQIDVSGFVLEGNHSWESMFQGCTNLTVVNGFDKLDLSVATNVYNMFNNCAITEVPKGFKGANFINVINGGAIFNYCKNLVHADFSGVKTSNKLTSTYAMFHMCSSLKTADLSGWTNTSKNTNISQMFVNDTQLESVNFSGWDTSSVTTTDSMFSNCSKLHTIIGYDTWNFPNCTNMNGMFSGCGSLTELNISNWGLEKIAALSSTFKGCSKITSLDLSMFNFNKDVFIDFSSLFNGMTLLSDLKLPSYLKGNNFASMFYNCTSLTDLSGITFEDAVDTNDNLGLGGSGGMNSTFTNCSNLEYIGTLINRGALRTTFVNCQKLKSIEELNFANTGNTDTYLLFQNFPIGNPLSIKFTGTSPKGFIGSSSNNTWNRPAFDHNTVLSLFNCLNAEGPNTSTIGSVTYPLVLNAKSIAVMSADEIAIATSKGWTVA